MVANLLLEKIKENDEIIFNCGRITSDGSRNSICSHVLLECSLRSFSVTKRYYFLKLLEDECKNLSSETNTKIIIDIDKTTQSVSNDYSLFNKNKKYLNCVIEPFFQAEDFSEYSKVCKTLYFLVGIGDCNKLHSDNFSFNIDNLKIGYDLFLNIINND